MRWHQRFGTNPTEVDMIILVFCTTRHYLLVSTGSNAYVMYLRYISAVHEKTLYLVLIIPDTIDLYGKISSTHVLTFVLYYSSARIARDL